MAEQLVADILEIEEEEALVPVEIDPILLMTDVQIKKEVEQLPPAQKALFEDVKKFVEDQEKESGECMPLDRVVSTLVKARYPRIPSTIVTSKVKPEEESKEDADVLPVYHTEGGTSDKVLVTAIFPSKDPAVINYNLKKKPSAERTNEDYKNIGESSDAEEIDSIKIVQIWWDMAKLKRDEAALYDRLAMAAPSMTQSDLLYSIEKTPKPSSHLPDCMEEMYTRMADPQRFRVALAAGERLVNIYKHSREDVKIESIEATAHHFEVRKKDIYELLRGDKYLKPTKKRETSVKIEEPAMKKPKEEEVPKQARCVVTTLLPPPTAEDQAAVGSSKQ